MQELITQYKSILLEGGLKNEIYKWEFVQKFRGRPNLNAIDFPNEIAQIDYGNLVYQLAKATAKDMAQNATEPYRMALRNLFDENKDLATRVTKFIKEIYAIYSSLHSDKTLGHHHDERTVSILLTLQNPDKYTFYKNSFYRKYCNLLKIKSHKTGSKFIHYLDLIRTFANDFVLKDKELLKMVDSEMPTDAFKDENRLLLAQDILFETLDASEIITENKKKSPLLNPKILARVLGINNRETTLYYFSLVKDLIEALNIEINDPRLAFNANESSRNFGLNVNNRYSLNLPDNGDVSFMIKDDVWVGLKSSIDFNKIGGFSNDPKCTWVSLSLESFKENYTIIKEPWLNAAIEYLNAQTASPYHDHHVPEIIELALDPLKLEPYFAATKQTLIELLSNLTNDESKMSPITEPLNQILFGPPGTGKTYKLKKEYFPKYTTSETSITEEKYAANIIKDMKWWHVIGMVLSELKSAKVQEILNHPWLKIKASFSESKNLQANIWGHLQERAPLDSLTVNVQGKRAPYIFDKIENSVWIILDETVENEVPEILEVMEKIKSFKPKSDVKIERFKFTTFHQSFSYEDFIEGIKPVMNEDETSGEVRYEIQPGIFKQICTEARNDLENRYAIFIDEINRGNVSAIFGELITLIEKDKRAGAENEMTATLPYSKDLFSVPSNVDIYGTMNTADRSVEALDTALRRRFSFVEMAPRPELIREVGESAEQLGFVEEIDMVQLLQVINQRIEKLIDKHHMIGHSYFLSVASLTQLKVAFQNKIIPLLQEYFFGDFGKIGLVLGEDFFEDDQPTNNVFAKFKDYDTSGLEDREIYRLKNVLDMPDEEFTKACLEITNG